MDSLPSGTLTFLFTDVEGSTRLWERKPDEMRAFLEEHDLLIQEAVEQHDGIVFKKMGDAVCAVFTRAETGIAAALHAQLSLIGAPEAANHPLPVRMALYTGYAQEAGGDYVGPTLNRTARILSAGHGGQVLLSEATRDLARDSLPAGASVLDLGAHHLKDLERSERIFQLVHASLPRDFPPLNSLSAFKHNLPIQLTALVGREAEILAVEDLLEDHRLVTLYGSGGCGKTRLALQVGAEVADRYPDGVWLVELGSAMDAPQAQQSVASALGLHETGGQDLGQVIFQHLRGRRALLILDNCEHLVEACATLALGLLKTCSSIKVLATSREVLGVHGEVTWRVPSLPVPSQTEQPSAADKASLLRNDSVRLFAERAAEAAPGFSVGPHNVGSIAWIAWRLDGIPLALELAAARVKSLTVDQICEKLRQHFDILVGPRTALPRHKTLQATLDWSFLLLEEREQALLARLTVFSGGWRLEAAEAVCLPRQSQNSDPFAVDEIVDLLSRLEDKSLISVDRQTESARYSMLQMVREYASERLTDEEIAALGERHLEYFLGIAEEAEANLSGPDQADWLRRLDSERDNLRAALDFAKRHLIAGDSGLLLAGMLSKYWYIRGYLSEGRRHLSAFMGLVKEKASSRGWGMAYNGAGILAYAQQDPKSARSFFTSALDVWRAREEPNRVAGALSNLGLIAIEEGRLEDAEDLLTKSLAIREDIGDKVGAGIALNNLGSLAESRGDYSSAVVEFNRSLDIRQALGDKLGEAECLNNLGKVLLELGRFEEACGYYQACLSILEIVRDTSCHGAALGNLGELHYRQGKYTEAKDYFRRSLEVESSSGPYFYSYRSYCILGDIARTNGNLDEAADLYRATLTSGHLSSHREWTARALLGFAKLALESGHDQKATTFLAAAMKLAQRVAHTGFPIDPTELKELSAVLGDRLGPAEFENALKHGEALQLEDAVRLSF